VTQWKARPTTYKGIQMRSRLEARFAAYLDSVGCVWTYEPRAFGDETGQYLPDFRLDIPGQHPAYIEVKPTMDMALSSLGRMQIIWSSEPAAPLMVVIDQTDTVLAAGSDRRWQTARLQGWPTGESRRYAGRLALGR
jgi:hypothetical protein